MAVAEDSRLVYFREGGGLLEHVAVLIGAQESWPDPVPVRLHSACLTGDLFGSMRCDCGEQLRGSLAHMKNRGFDRLNLRGLIKAKIAALWHALAHNVLVMNRLRFAHA